MENRSDFREEYTNNAKSADMTKELKKMEKQCGRLIKMDFNKLNNMCEWEQEKAMFLIQIP